MTRCLKIAVVSLWICSVFLAGCTSRQLRRDHVLQAKAVTTIYEQQVLDNLAMFHRNQHSLPFFSLAGTGALTVADSAGSAVGPFNVGQVVIAPISFGRNNTQNFTLTAINEPMKLQRMQMLYQQAINGGLMISKCSKRDVVDSACRLSGTYCGCSIEIPMEGRQAFNQLVLAIMDVAINDPPAAEPMPTIQVEDYIYDDNGRVDKIHRFSTMDTGMQGAAREGQVVVSQPAMRPEMERNTVRRELRELENENQLNLLRGALFQSP